MNLSFETTSLEKFEETTLRAKLWFNGNPTFKLVSNKEQLFFGCFNVISTIEYRAVLINMHPFATMIGQDCFLPTEDVGGDTVSLSSDVFTPD